MEYTLLLNSPSSNILYDSSNIDFELLNQEAEAYCKEFNLDFRLYNLGLRLSKEASEANVFAFFKAFSEVKSFKNLWSKFAIEMLGNNTFGTINNCQSDAKAIAATQTVIDLYTQHGDDIPVAAAKAAESAAESAARSVERQKDLNINLLISLL